MALFIQFLLKVFTYFVVILLISVHGFGPCVLNDERGSLWLEMFFGHARVFLEDSLL